MSELLAAEHRELFLTVRDIMMMGSNAFKLTSSLPRCFLPVWACSGLSRERLCAAMPCSSSTAKPSDWRRFLSGRSKVVRKSLLEYLEIELLVRSAVARTFCSNCLRLLRSNLNVSECDGVHSETIL